MSEPNDLSAATLRELAEVKGQLTLITQLITQNNDATHQRINDLRHAIEGRFNGVESRVGQLEKNERETATKTAAVGALAGAVSSALVSATVAILHGGHGS